VARARRKPPRSASDSTSSKPSGSPTIELRSALLREAKKLLPQAIRQAKGEGKRPGSPALLRLIARLAMRNTQIEKRPR